MNRRRCLGGTGLCSNPERLAEPGRSRCRNHGGKAWSRIPPARQAAYTSSEYQRNRKLVIEREPICHWRFPGCTLKSTTADHLLSVAKGGGHALENLVGACSKCNEKRGGAEGRVSQRRRPR